MKGYIEREAVLELLRKWADGYSYIEIEAASAIRNITAIPAADVKPVVRGEWIEHYEHYDTGEEQREAQYGYVCSVCGRWEYEKEPFCNCGADMRGEQDG